MNRKLFLLPALFGALMLFTTACNQDECKNVDCGEFGSCFSGSCICDDGYEEDVDGKCTVLMRAKFLGTYTCTDDCVPGASWSSTVNISATAINKIVIGNFGNSGQNVVCTVNGSNVSIDSGQITSGTGSISGNRITLNFNNPAPPPATCNMTMNKQ